MKKKSYKLLIALAIGAFMFTLNNASAQRYRSRDQDQNSQEPALTQDSLQNETFAQRLVKGSNFDVGFSSVSTFIEISPVLGYRLTPKLQAGIGLSYIYANNLYGNYDPNTGLLTSSYWQSSTAYGGRLYAEYDIAKLGRSIIFAHAELEDLNVPYQDPTTYKISRFWLESPYVGVGLREPLGNNVFLNASILLNANYNQFSKQNQLFDQIVERVGITF